MQVYVFNACLLIGWALVILGGAMLNLGAGLVGGGLLLIVLALVATRMAGGLYVDPPAAPGESGAG